MSPTQQGSPWTSKKKIFLNLCRIISRSYCSQGEFFNKLVKKWTKGPSRLNPGPWRRKYTAERRRLKRQNLERQRDDAAKLHKKLMDEVLHTTAVVDDEDVQSLSTPAP